MEIRGEGMQSGMGVNTIDKSMRGGWVHGVSDLLMTLLK